MSAAISFSGFNNIDFNQILNILIAQERVPITAMQARQQSLQAQSGAYSSLAGKLGALESASSALGRTSDLQGRTVSSSNTGIASASVASGAALGSYEIVVRGVAHPQVTASASHHADADTTAVATGGSLTIGGVEVALSGDVTLQGLATRINGTDGVGVVASVVHDASGYRLVLTGTSTGAEHAFTVTNALTGSSVAFTDTDLDGVSGDSAADNALQAEDAILLVNNVEVTSGANTVTDAIPGVTLNLARTSPDEAVTIAVADDTGSTRSLVESFVSAYNDLVDFSQQQVTATNGIGRDGLLRGLRFELRNHLSAQYASGGSFSSLALVGVEFDRTGKLTIDADRLETALADDDAAVRALFAGDGSNTGVFPTIEEALGRYTGSGALLDEVTNRLDDQVRAMDDRMAAMEMRLAVRREALQKEFMATDSLISQLNSQLSSLQSLASQFSLF